MNITPMGRVNVTTAGTPVQLTTDTTIRVTKLFVQVIPGLTSKIYIGKQGLSKSTLSGVARILWPNQSGGISDSFLISADDSEDSIRLSEYWIDSDVSGEGLLVTYWTN